MRNPTEVAEQIRDIVPEEHKAKFEHLIWDFSYKAPEQRLWCWGRLSHLCNALLGEEGKFEYPWQVKMISILAMLTEAELTQKEK